MLVLPPLVVIFLAVMQVRVYQTKVLSSLSRVDRWQRLALWVVASVTALAFFTAAIARATNANISASYLGWQWALVGLVCLLVGGVVELHPRAAPAAVVVLATSAPAMYLGADVGRRGVVAASDDDPTPAFNGSARAIAAGAIVALVLARVVGVAMLRRRVRITRRSWVRVGLGAAVGTSAVVAYLLPVYGRAGAFEQATTTYSRWEFAGVIPTLLACAGLLGACVLALVCDRGVARGFLFGASVVVATNVLLSVGLHGFEHQQLQDGGNGGQQSLLPSTWYTLTIALLLFAWGASLTLPRRHRGPEPRSRLEPRPPSP